MRRLFKQFNDNDMIMIGGRFAGGCLMTCMLLEFIYKLVAFWGSLVGGLVLTVWLTCHDLNERAKASDKESDAFAEAKQRLDGK